MSLESASLGGVIKFAGVVAMDDSVEEVNPGLSPGALRRFSAASSAASLIDMAEVFLFLN